MKKLYDKDEVWFAVIWIIVYVIGFANADAISETIGIPKLLTVLVGSILTIILLYFIRKHRLVEYYGLCPLKGGYKEYLYFVPLMVMSSVNLWNGIEINNSTVEIALFVISMCLVGILEEVIFRGLLFKGMCKSNVLSAIVVSSITFGMGHIVNLFLGEPVFDTLLQLVYASAIGFCYTAIFCVSNSIYPCIISHAVVNSTSIIGVEPSGKMKILIMVVQTVLGLGYGIWLLKKQKRDKSI